MCRQTRREGKEKEKKKKKRKTQEREKLMGTHAIKQTKELFFFKD